MQISENESLSAQSLHTMEQIEERRRSFLSTTTLGSDIDPNEATTSTNPSPLKSTTVASPQLTLLQKINNSVAKAPIKPIQIQSMVTIKPPNTSTISSDQKLRRVTVQALDMNVQYKIFIKSVFNSDIPPLVIYDRAIRQGTKLYQLEQVTALEPKPEKGQYWILFKNKMELTTAYRDHAIRWQNVKQGEKSMIVCVRKYNNI